MPDGQEWKAALVSADCFVVFITVKSEDHVVQGFGDGTSLVEGQEWKAALVSADCFVVFITVIAGIEAS